MIDTIQVKEHCYLFLCWLHVCLQEGNKQSISIRIRFCSTQVRRLTCSGRKPVVCLMSHPHTSKSNYKRAYLLHLNQPNNFQAAKNFSSLQTSRNHSNKMSLIVATRLSRHVFTPLSGFPTQGDNIAIQPVSGSGECQGSCMQF